MDLEAVLQGRVAKFRKIGIVEEEGIINPHIKQNIKKYDTLHEEEDLVILPSCNGNPSKLLIATSDNSRYQTCTYLMHVCFY